jgi:hypothetical protein
MLAHESVNQEAEQQNVSAALRARVTPEELARAIAALESKREAERQQQHDTVPLGEMVHQLGIDVTPEELLAEVEEARAARIAAQQAGGRRLTPRQANWFLIFLLALLVAPTLLAVLFARLRVSPPRKASPTLAMIPLSQVADGQIVHIDYHTLSSLAAGQGEAGKMLVDARLTGADRTAGSPAFDTEWTLIRQGNAFVVRAWATAEQILRCSNEQRGIVFSSRPPWLPAANVMTVDLPLYRFQEIDDDSLHDFDSKGGQTDAAVGIVQEVATHGVDELVKHALQQSSVTNTLQHEGYSYSPSMDVSVDGGVVTLTGTMYSEASKRKATQLTEEKLHKLGITDHVINNIEVSEL